MGHPAPIVAHTSSFPYSVYPPAMDVAPRALQPPTSGPPQTWQAPNGIAPAQTHLAPPPQAQQVPAVPATFANIMNAYPAPPMAAANSAEPASPYDATATNGAGRRRSIANANGMDR